MFSLPNIDMPRAYAIGESVAYELHTANLIAFHQAAKDHLSMLDASILLDEINGRLNNHSIK